MSKRKLKRLAVSLGRCEGCNQLVHPKRLFLVDPAVINVKRAPLYLCTNCRGRLAWNKNDANRKQ